VTTLVVEPVNDDDPKPWKNNIHGWERIDDVLVLLSVQKTTGASAVFLLETLGNALGLEAMLDNAYDDDNTRRILPDEVEDDGGETMNDVEVKIPVLLVVAAAHGVDIQRNDFFGSVVHDDL
jgi:hypothetical protein